jgi:hypothetical protein
MDDSLGEGLSPAALSFCMIPSTSNPAVLKTLSKPELDCTRSAKRLPMVRKVDSGNEGLSTSVCRTFRYGAEINLSR